MLWVLIAGCTEYDLKGDPTTGVPSDPTTPPTTDDPTTPPPDDPAELCDGVDNDGDGTIDEGFADTDADGVADCLDDGCLLDLPAAGVVSVREECIGYDGSVVADPWNVVLEWSFTTTAQIVVSPVTGQLTDDNADGLIDAADVPDVAFTEYGSFYAPAQLFIVRGDGSGEVCRQAGWRSDGGVIIADVDSDGRNEVVGPLSDGRITAVDGACNTKWTSAQAYGLLYPVTTAGDLDADGDVEVVSDVAVVDGATGAPLATLAPLNPSCWRTPLTGDLDQDGDLEIVLGDSVFDGAGTRLWSSAGSGASCFNAVANLDTDVQGEVVFAIGPGLYAYEHDGTPIWYSALSVANPGPPCAGDIDGDGEVEIVAPNGSQLSAFEANGAPKWTVGMQDFSGAAGCVVFDMNGDEIYEVLFADETALRVYDGTTGAVLYENPLHDSVTYFETPTVADVDNDGSAEMLVVNSGFGQPGLTVFGHAGSGWPAAGPTWGLHDFSATNQDPSGAIPQVPVAPWLEYNICRGRPFADVPDTPNLAPAAVDLCVSSCDPDVGVVTVSFQVWNDGGADAEATTVSLFTVSGGIETFYTSQPVPAMVSGELGAALVFEVLLADWTGEIAIRTDDDGGGGGLLSECYEDDNVTVYAADPCP